MEYGKGSAISVEKGGAPKKNVRLDENDHHLIVGAVAAPPKEGGAQPSIETPAKKKRPRIKKKIDY